MQGIDDGKRGEDGCGANEVVGLGVKLFAEGE